MDTPEKQSPATVTYLSGTSAALGPEWDVMQVAYRSIGIGASHTIARNASGTIIRKIDSSPKRWVVVNDEDSLRAYREWFDNRDGLLAEKAAGAGRKVEEE
jgi:hypothetical protein